MPKKKFNFKNTFIDLRLYKVHSIEALEEENITISLKILEKRQKFYLSIDHFNVWIEPLFVRGLVYKYLNL